MTDIENYMLQLGRQAREASRQIAKASTAQKNAALLAVAEAIDSSREPLMQANEQDMRAGREKGAGCSLARPLGAERSAHRRYDRGAAPGGGSG